MARRVACNLQLGPAPFLVGIWAMATPLVVDVLRDQLMQMLLWHRHQQPAFQWGVVLHRRNERGHYRFGAVTPAGESLLVSGPLIERLREQPCWLDGVVPVRFEIRQLDEHSWTPTAHVPLVDALAVYFDANQDAVEMRGEVPLPAAGILTPATMPSELFVLTRERPEGWPL